MDENGLCIVDLRGFTYFFMVIFPLLITGYTFLLGTNILSITSHDDVAASGPRSAIKE